MGKYKICPSCLTKNDPSSVECSNCEADLTGVKITDEEAENVPKAESETTIVKPAFVRLCDCGAKNPANARKCSACGEDISDVTPTPDKSEKQNKTAFVLSSFDGQYAYKLTEEKVEVGKESAMGEYLITKPYVSRHHAIFYANGGKLYIENISTTNFTFVNNVRINEKCELHDGDEIGLGGTSVGGNRQNKAAYFLVRIGSCM